MWAELNDDDDDDDGDGDGGGGGGGGRDKFLTNLYKTQSVMHANDDKVKKQIYKEQKSETGITASVLPSIGQKNNIAQPKADKWFNFPSHFSSFLTV